MSTGGLIFAIYLMGIVDSISGLTETFGWLFILSWGAIRLSNTYDRIGIGLKFINRLGMAGVILATIGVLTPSRKSVILMTGVAVGSKTFEAINGSEEFNKVKKLINLTLDNLIEKQNQTNKGERGQHG